MRIVIMARSTLNVCFEFLKMTISLRFNCHFPAGPGLAGTKMFTFWILLELRVMEVAMTTGAISSNQNVITYQQTSTQFFTNWMPFLSPNQKK